MTTQHTLFDLGPPDRTEANDGEACLTSGTADDRLSPMPDKRSVRRLATLARRLETTDDSIKIAGLAAEVRDLADRLVADSINQANRDGLTWRQIGAELGIPFQTLYRRYGAS